MSEVQIHAGIGYFVTLTKRELVVNNILHRISYNNFIVFQKNCTRKLRQDSPPKLDHLSNNGSSTLTSYKKSTLKPIAEDKLKKETATEGRTRKKLKKLKDNREDWEELVIGQEDAEVLDGAMDREDHATHYLTELLVSI